MVGVLETRVARQGGSGRRLVVSWALVWVLVATLAWAVSPTVAVVAQEQEEGPGFERRAVAPLPAGAGERELEVPEGDFTDPPLQGARALLAAEERESSFDPETSVVVEGETTETRLVYENVDGSRTAVVSAGPVRFEEDGEWREIDLGLVEGDGELVPEAARSGVTFPSDAGADGVAVHETSLGDVVVGVPSVVESPGEPVVASVGPLEQIVVEGAGGVSSVVTPLSTGFEHDVVFPTAASAEASFTVELSVPSGVVAVPDDHGVALVAGDEVVAHYGGGVAFDAVGAVEGGRETPVATTLVAQVGDVVMVEVSVDAAWLADPGREFPVTVDPTYTSIIGITSGGGDTYVNQAAPTTSYASAVDLRIGKATDGSVYRSFVRFGLSGIPSGAVIYDATMQLVNFASTSCTPALVRARTASSDFGPTTTWNTQPGTGGVVSDSYFSLGATGCPGGWTFMDATSAVTAWYANPSANRGLRLSADEATTAGYKRFYSSAFGSGREPRLVVTYDRLPPVPPQVAPIDGARVPTLQPTLSVSPVTDPDGEPVRYWFQMWSGEGLPWDGQLIRSGWISSTSWTVPTGALADGVTYSWTAFARGGDGLFHYPTSSRTVTTDRRLTGGRAPTESVGPITVNLVTGDAGYATGSPGVSTLGGGIAPSYSYHSMVRPASGLTGAYYVDANSNNAFDDGPATVVRTDSEIAFDWSTVTPFDALPPEQFMVRWSGFVTVPTSGTYHFGAAGSNGFKVIVNGSTVVNRWPTSWSAVPVYGTGTALTAGQTVPVTLEMVDSPGQGAWMDFTYKLGTTADVTVPASWLTPARQTSQMLSPGWDLDLGGELSWEQAQVTNDSITVVDAEGGVLEFHREPGGGFAPDDESTAVVSLDGTGRVTLQDGPMTYVFAADGTLVSATEGRSGDSTDVLSTWATTTTGGVTYRRITSITDPVSSRSVSVTWRLPGATCPTAPSGFDTNPPTGSLCRVGYWDGTHTAYHYKAGQLARIVDPGGVTTDFGYTVDGILGSVRDSLAHDAVAAGVRSDDDTVLTQVSYSAGSGRATTVRQPAPTAGAPRPQATISYGSGTTDVAVAGATNGSGYSRRVTFDASGRLTGDTDVAGRTTTTEWNPNVDDETWSTTDPLGLRTTDHFDANGLPTDTYGPAPVAWFGGDRRPLPAHVAEVPHESTAYDENLHTLAVSWFANRDLADAPVETATGVGGPSGTITRTWTTSPTGGAAFSGRMTGSITFPANGTYSLRLTKNGKGRLWIGSSLVVDGWASAGTATGTFVATAGSTHQIRIEYASPASGTGSLTLAWTPPSGSLVTVPGTALRTQFSNPTTIAGDGMTEQADYTGVGGKGPEDGLPTTITLDPAGAALSTGHTYEADGAGWNRMLSRTLPAGNTYTYAYYGGTETRDNPCTPAVDPAVQGGLLKTLAAPAAADSSIRVDETVYDVSGRVVASRIGGGGWTCTTYDSRGRTTSIDHPAFGGAPARTVTYTYDVGGSPLVTEVIDPAGTVSATVDLFGRTVQAVDVWGAVTATTYDQAGRVTATTVTADGVTWTVADTYNVDGTVATRSLDGLLIAVASYDGQGRLSAVDYPSAGGAVGNGTALAPLVYDAKDRIVGMTWLDGTGATLTSDAVAYDVNDRIVDQVIDGHDPTPSGPSFVYDSTARLTSAVIANRDPATGVPTGVSRTLGYEFAPTGGCGVAANAGRNTNRTALTVDGLPVATYCYDGADRLTSTTQPSYTGTIGYDGHGNTTAIAGETRFYDGADRHRSTTDGTTTVTYGRDAHDRIVERVVDGVVVARYVHSDTGDSPGVVLDGTGALIQRSIGLPGGVAYSDTGPSGTQSWSYPNIHGDVAAQADGFGAKDGPTRTYDPFGTPITELADTAPGAFDHAWLGVHLRPLEHEGGLRPTIEMGARQYDPTLGRFLEVDPIEGGSANDYDYANADPINNQDLDGLCSARMGKRKQCLRSRAVKKGGGYCPMGRSRGCYGRMRADDTCLYFSVVAGFAFKNPWQSGSVGVLCHYLIKKYVSKPCGGDLRKDPRRRCRLRR